MPLDTKELMRQVARLRIITNRLVDNRLTGAYHSAFKGQGIEFDEVRAYNYGDDVRSIDWNVTARMGHPYIKRFAEERELTILFVVDVSGSQIFGSTARNKAETAAELTCLLALSAVKNQDNVGLILFSDRIRTYIPPRKGRKAVLRIVREVLAAEETREATNIRSALDFLAHVQKRRAVVFLLSDFIDNGYDDALRIAAKRHDLICCPITDPHELALPPAGILELEDAESGERYLIDTADPQFRDAYRKQTSDRNANLLRTFRRNRIDAVPLSTDTPVIDAVRRLFLQRQARQKRG
ncbi:MAG: DUF58 domain-containing protein [Kiritimatiellia bacterium]